ncbi:uncharacterized protein MELLADRAFT_91279 [Melampsora larici-populina 98AG31]|uniref:Uncharacterized protein n=1 Tax=Melampsora larici-populina (strain 98AG31 / pathotype 3-4-7) TaxID=747676 RepID=F4RYG7_MELLP|nr:uncharacterized protein MELLADRAFT_91279 [Melampsora larici-populina 98AG31]EGG02580.1 hypothetical protein MELLADRAFT_91279 [Melampsora larici-populina 98AG31]
MMTFEAVFRARIYLSLREDFGFQHLSWVCSGRRGIHCWVSDGEALKLTDEQRKGIVNFLDILRGGGSRHAFMPATYLSLTVNMLAISGTHHASSAEAKKKAVASF